VVTKSDRSSPTARIASVRVATTPRPTSTKNPELAKEIEARIYVALGLTGSLVEPIERLDDGDEASDDEPLDFEKEVAAITSSDEPPIAGDIRAA